MLRPDNLLGLCCRDVKLAPNDAAANWALIQAHGHPQLVRVPYSQLKDNVVRTAPTPAHYCWSAMATDAEMCASAEFDSAGACVRCRWPWCNLPIFTYVCIRVREAAHGFSMSAAIPFFVTPVVEAADSWVSMSHVAMTKSWWQAYLDAIVLVFDAALSARGCRRLYSSRRGATQFLWAYTGEVEMVTQAAAPD